MTTMAHAIKQYVQSVGGKVTAEQIKQAINAAHPGQWKASTLQAHLYACAANNPKAYIHHPSAEKQVAWMELAESVVSWLRSSRIPLRYIRATRISIDGITIDGVTH